MKSICLTIASLFSIAVMSQGLTPQQIDEGHYSLYNTALTYRQLISDGSQYYQDSSLWNLRAIKLLVE